MRFSSDAGLSVLELVVVLGIVAGLLAVVAGLLPRPSAEEHGDTARIAAFISEARSRAIMSGEIGVLTINRQSMTIGTHRINWSADLAVKAAGAWLPDDHRLLLYPDGSYSGRRLQVHSPNGSLAIAGVYRSNPSDG